MRAMLARFPAFASVPHVELGTLPTPVDHARSLGAAIGLTSLYIKRDDLSSDLFGGSKVRKLEFLLAEAKSRGHTSVVAFGGAGSNQTVATAAFGRMLGLKVIVHLAGQPRAPFLRERILANYAFGADVRSAPSVHAAEVAALRDLEKHGTQAPYVIPSGGSSARGNLGFVAAAFELAEQTRAGDIPEPAFIVAALGTTGSVAGLSVGLALAGLSRTKVIGVRASSPDTSSMRAIASMQREIIRELGRHGIDFAGEPAACSIEQQFLGRGYGYATREGKRAGELAEATHGLSLDPVYTEKAMAALVKRAPDLGSAPVVFWASHPTTKVDTQAVDERAVAEPLRQFL